MSKFPSCGILSIEGVKYCWELDPAWRDAHARDSNQGLSIRVFFENRKAKELVIEFSLEEFNWHDQQTIYFLPERIKSSIIQALQAGWEPFERRKVAPRKGKAHRSFPERRAEPAQQHHPETRPAEAPASSPTVAA